MSYFIMQADQFVNSYVVECKGKQRTNKKPIPCSPNNQQSSDDDIIIVGDKEDKMKFGQTMKYKLLQFHENYRPAYYGTWQRSSKIIQPRNPFKKDEVSFCNKYSKHFIYSMHS